MGLSINSDDLAYASSFGDAAKAEWLANTARLWLNRTDRRVVRADETNQTLSQEWLDWREALRDAARGNPVDTLPDEPGA